MMHIAWCCLEEVPYCFSRSSVKFQGHTALKIFKFDPDWAFPDCNSSLNSPMAKKWCTKLQKSLKQQRRDALLFSKVIHQISRSHGTKHCFHVLHNVRHKIWTIFMMLKTFSFADLFPRQQCWSIYWWISWFLSGFEYIAKNHHRLYITTMTEICVGSQGNVREKSGIFFSDIIFIEDMRDWHTRCKPSNCSSISGTCFENMVFAPEQSCQNPVFFPLFII